MGSSYGKEPLISVILPIYNVEQYLPRCMASIMRQSYTNIEIVMVDDGSDKPCADLCDEYSGKDPRINVYHKVNGGISDARNYGVKHASGEYITYIDPDDYVDNDYVEYLYSILCKYGTRMSICQHRVSYQNGSLKEYGADGDEMLSVPECIERMMYHDVIDTSAWAKLYHCSLFETVRYPKGKIFEDMAITYQLMMQCEGIGVGYESKYNYNFHNNSIVNGSFQHAKLDLLDMTDTMARDVIEAFPQLRSAVQRRQVYARLSTLNQMLNASDCEEERNNIMEYIQCHRKEVLQNSKTPKRDKMALLLLAISYRLYRTCWLLYRRRICMTVTSEDEGNVIC